MRRASAETSNQEYSAAGPHYYMKSSQFFTRLAAILCTFSTLFILDLEYGLNTGEAYSTGV